MLSWWRCGVQAEELTISVCSAASYQYYQTLSVICLTRTLLCLLGPVCSYSISAHHTLCQDTSMYSYLHHQEPFPDTQAAPQEYPTLLMHRQCYGQVSFLLGQVHLRYRGQLYLKGVTVLFCASHYIFLTLNRVFSLACVGLFS